MRGRYVDFHRGFNKGLRAIMTCTSDDFIHWTAPEWITYNDDRAEHLYTNQTTPYPRAIRPCIGIQASRTSCS